MTDTASWDDYKTTLALIKYGTLAKAASELGVTYTTVARRISRLEDKLGQRLFERLSDGYRPTEYAHLVANQADMMQQAEHSLFRQLQQRDNRLRGPLTITAPQLIISNLLTPILRQFKELYPEIELFVRATNETLDLNNREADLAIRISNAPGDNLKGLRIAEQKTTWFATHDIVQTLLADHQTPLNIITYIAYKTLPDGLVRAFPNAKISYTFDDMIPIHSAAKSGLGAARMPFFLGNQTPELVQLPYLKPQPYMDVWLVAHPDIWSSAKVEAFRKMATHHLKSKSFIFTQTNKTQAPTT